MDKEKEKEEYPSMDVSGSDNDKVIRGSKEGFIDTADTNVLLIEKRIRDKRLKTKEFIIGKKTKTKVVIVYLEGVARKYVLDELMKRLNSISPDWVLDSGIIEQEIEDDTRSVFPQYQTTERPDKAAMEILRGRIAIIVDNSPVVLLAPTNISSFLKTTDDYYNRHLVVTIARIIRYMAVFIAVMLPAIYLAIVNYHPEILPTPLAVAFAKERVKVPFPAVVEVLLMEISFELIREAGIRIPGPMGSTIGIVGGLIIGQAAVNAKIVSPIIVIVVALTALASFAITNEEFSSALRVLKYVMIALAYFLGFFGVIAGGLFIMGHLSTLKNYGFPYLMPYVADEINGDNDKKDGIIKASWTKLKKRSIFEKPR